jgi:RNA polymerase sigma factor (sigma-70 family)
MIYSLSFALNQEERTISESGTWGLYGRRPIGLVTSAGEQCAPLPLALRQPCKMEFRALSYYGNDAPPPRSPPLTPVEEQALFTQFAKRKTPKVRERLVRQYLCWAFGVAAKFKGPRLNFDEAISVANEGLMEALSGYNPALGFRFTTYAMFILRRKLIEAIVSTYPVRVSDHVRKGWRELEEPPEKLAAEFSGDCEPRTLEEFFERLGETSNVDISLLHEQPTDAPFVPAGGADPADCTEKLNLSEELRGAIKRLVPLQQKIVLARHFKEPPESYISLSKRLHISKTSARKAYDTGIARLKQFFRKDT